MNRPLRANLLLSVPVNPKASGGALRAKDKTGQKEEKSTLQWRPLPRLDIEQRLEALEKEEIEEKEDKEEKEEVEVEEEEEETRRRSPGGFVCGSSLFLAEW